MAELRIRGQEATIRVIRDGNLVTEISAIKNFTFEPRTRILTEQYLGETSSRQDSIFDEVGGSFTVNPEGTDILALQRMLVDRAQRRVANDEKVSATFRMQFPNGQIARISIPDMFFEPVPVNVGSRDAYIEMQFTYKASSFILTV